jgi:hypothetical protein
VEEQPLRWTSRASQKKVARTGEGGRWSSRSDGSAAPARRRGRGPERAGDGAAVSSRRRGRRAERAGDGASAAAAKEDLEREIFRGDGTGDRGSRSLCLVTVSSAAKPGGR